MGAHLVFMGPSTAGKSALMRGLHQVRSTRYKFTIDRHWTTRTRRLAESLEGNEEHVFVGLEAFDLQRSEFLFTFHTYGSYEYGVPVPLPLEEREVRMRVLQPVLALRFRRLVPAPTVLCTIHPYAHDAQAVMYARDRAADPAEIGRRLASYDADLLDAASIADFTFQNQPGLDQAIPALHEQVTDYLQVAGL